MVAGAAGVVVLSLAWTATPVSRLEGPVSAADRTCVEFKLGEAGAVLPAEFFRQSALLAALAAVALEAPETVGRVIVITDVWRPDAAGGYHPKLRAFDVRSGVEDLQSARRGAVQGLSEDDRYASCVAWCDRIRLRIGREFDVVFGREVDHVDHLHVEHDERKAARAFVQL